MANCLIAWPNRADMAAISGAPWSTTLPLSNLQNRFSKKVARSTGISFSAPTPAVPDASQCSAYMNIDLGDKHYLTAVALANHNLSLTAMARVVLWADSSMSVATYDSGWSSVWPRWYDTVSLRWCDSNFLFGRISLEDYGVVPAIWIHALKNANENVSPYPARYITIYLQDLENADGYIEIGRLYLASDWTPVKNMTYGDTSLGWTDPTIVDFSLDGTEYYEDRPKYREITFVLKAMSYEEGVNKALKLAQNRGVSGDILFVFDPENARLLQQRSFIGRLSELSPLAFTNVNMTQMPFKVKEIA